VLNSLAAGIEEGAAGLAAFAEGRSDTEWGTPASPTDRRTVGQILNHVALVYPIEVDLARVGIARDLKGKTLTITLVSDEGASEAVRVVE